MKVLPNGLTLIVCERPEAPVFSFYTLVDAGSANDPQGAIRPRPHVRAHGLQGDRRDRHDQLSSREGGAGQGRDTYAAYDAEYRKRWAGSGEAGAVEEGLRRRRARGAEVCHPQPVHRDRGAERRGRINASTARTRPQYFWSMPSNRLELWAYLESGRIGHPVQREFYKERDVVQEERRMRTDSNPIGRMVEQFLATAYVAHPYGRSGVGWESEISQVTATEADGFHKKYYVPSNIVIAVVGDVKASEAMPILEKYFAPIPAGPKPEPMTTIEPQQFAEKSVVISEADAALLSRGLPSARLSRSRRRCV